MKNWALLLAAIGVVATTGCNREFVDNSKVKTVMRPAGQQTDVATEAQAAAMGVKLQWLQTEIDDDGDSFYLIHTLLVNDKRHVIAGRVNAGTNECHNRDATSYIPMMMPLEHENYQHGLVHVAVGVSSCFGIDGRFYMGLSAMAWNSANIAQELVMLDLDANPEVRQITKSLRTPGSELFLPYWMASLSH